MNVKFIHLLLLFLTAQAGLFAQRSLHTHAQQPPTQRCHTMEADAELRAAHPELGNLDEFEVWLQGKIREAETTRKSGGTAVITIPVIVHVIHNGEAVGSGSNISKAQIDSQIEVLNEDFRRTNPDASSTPSAFSSVAADCEIMFCPALVDPQGNTLAEPGIDRINRNSKGFTTPPYSSTSYIDNTIKPNTYWDPNNYMNVWVLNLGGGLLGYAQFPSNSTLSGLNTNGGSATTDGVVIGYKYYGSITKVNTTQLQQGAPYNKGRTATHEIGHWLGLRHIWGDSNCGNDFCGDTPTSQTSNYGCPNFPKITCSNGPNGDMFMNYMDYSDDGCMNIFTNNQKTRMVTVMNNATRRSSLKNSTVCNSATSAPVANFTANLTTVCPGNTVQFTSTSTGSPTTYSWTFAGGTPATSTSQNPTVTYNTAGTYTVTLTVSNANGSNTKTQNSYITVTNVTPATLPLVEGFEAATFVPSGWSLGTPSTDTFEWKRTTAVSGFGTSTACTYFDNFWGDNSSNPDGTRDELIAKPFSLANATTAELKFDVAYAYVIVNNQSYADTLFVHVSTNCGASWTQVYKKQASTLQTASPRTNPTSQFVPTASQWRTETISLNSYAGQSNVLVRFMNGSNWGDYLYLDNVNITSTGGSTVQASFTANSQTVCAGQTVNFNSTSTGNPTAYSWTFAGGTPATSTAQNPTVTYNTAGTYNVSLTASNANGSNTANQSNYITVNPLPTAGFTYSAVTGTVTFNNSSTNGTSYSWNFGDGSTSTQMNPTHTYANNGVYNVVLVVTNGCGSQTFNMEVVITGVSIDEAFSQSLSLYPNPNDGNFTLEVKDAASGSLHLAMYNLHGQQLFERAESIADNYSKINLNMQNLASGTYLLVVRSGEKTARLKLMVE